MREIIRVHRSVKRELGSEEEVERSTNRQMTDIRKAVDEIQRESSDLRSQEVQFTVPATDPEREIRVRHHLDRLPNRWKVVFQSGFGSLKPSRKRLGDLRNVYFLTDAEEGTVFCVVPYRTD